MPKPRDAGSLREAVHSQGFTPGLRDVDGVVALLGDDDEPVVRAAEKALVRAAHGDPKGDVVTRLLRCLEGASTQARAHGFRVVGTISPTDKAAAAAVIAGLSDAEPRVRRAAVNALGRFTASEAKADIGEALLRVWDEVPELPLARALAEALGKLGVEQARSRLEAARGGDAELDRVARRAELMLARDGSRGEDSGIDGSRAAGSPASVVLLCRRGLERMVEAELREKCPGATSIHTALPGEVTALWSGAPDDLFSVRTMLSFAFVLPGELIGAETPPDACVRALSSSAAQRILSTWTRGSVRYRIDWRGDGHKRGATWEVVHALSTSQPTWVNDPTDSTWQVSVGVGPAAPGAPPALHALLFPRKLADPRFTYRVRDVPAASHPTLAAALVRASDIGETDVVWDPFVGSGTELVERARAGPYRALIGTDLDPLALDAARENLAAANLADVSLSEGDATTCSPEGVTRIVTNPPMGRRVARDGSLADLLDRFTDHAYEVLGKGGVVSWLSPLGGRTAARAEARGFQVTTRQEVDMGGFSAELQVWKR